MKPKGQCEKSLMHFFIDLDYKGCVGKLKQNGKRLINKAIRRDNKNKCKNHEDN